MAEHSVEKKILETVKKQGIKMVLYRLEPFVRQKCLERSKYGCTFAAKD